MKKKSTVRLLISLAALIYVAAQVWGWRLGLIMGMGAVFFWSLLDYYNRED